MGWNGRWTSNGKFFLFEQLENGRSNLWFQREKPKMFLPSSDPVRLTNGPLSFDAPLPSIDGKRIYAVGYQSRGELIRFDSRSKQFVSYLNGISATDVVYTPDGKWLIYLSYPAHELLSKPCRWHRMAPNIYN